jgi:hypothetical protein
VGKSFIKAYQQECILSISMSIHEKLVDFLNRSRDWERKSTNIPGIFLLKLPSSRTRQASIAIEINPVDAAGAATKKRGIVIRSSSELNEFNRILGNQKLIELARRTDEVNPVQKDTSNITGSDIFEI